MSTIRGSWRYAAFFVILLLLAAWSTVRLLDSRQSAQLAVDGLQTCRDLATKIQELSQSPAQAWTEADAPFEQLRLKLENAAQDVKIPPANLVSVSQQPARRLKKTAYLVEPAQIDLRGVSLRQLVNLLAQIVADRPGLSVQSIRLSAPRGSVRNETDETWTAEVVLTHLIFSPELARPSS